MLTRKISNYSGRVHSAMMSRGGAWGHDLRNPDMPCRGHSHPWLRSEWLLRGASLPPATIMVHSGALEPFAASNRKAGVSVRVYGLARGKIGNFAAIQRRVLTHAS